MLSKTELDEILSNSLYPNLSALIYGYYTDFCGECDTKQYYCELCETYQCECWKDMRFCSVRECHKFLCCERAIRTCDCVPGCANNWMCERCWNIDDYVEILAMIRNSRNA